MSVNSKPLLAIAAEYAAASISDWAKAARAAILLLAAIYHPRLRR